MNTTATKFDQALRRMRAWNTGACLPKRHADLMSGFGAVRAGRSLTHADFDRLGRQQPGIGGSTDGSIQP